MNDNSKIATPRWVVPCKWCGKPTPMLGTKMCDGCWEIDHRIRGNLPLAERIITYYKERDDD